MSYATRALAVASALLMGAPTAVLAHTNSIGYVGGGNGSVTFWYGNWHPGTTFNEGTLTLQGINGTTFAPSTVNWTLIQQTMPDGLIPGTNYFTSNGTQLVPYDPSIQTSYSWQGVTFTGLSAGDYQFTYNAAGSPTVNWMPMDSVILSSTVSLSAAALSGDANQNGVLDIYETGGTPPPPTVTGTSTSNSVSTSTSSSTRTETSYVTRTVNSTDADGNPVVRTYTDTIVTTIPVTTTTTTTTPVTTTTWSDGTTTTSNGTPVVTTSSADGTGTAAVTATALDTTAVTRTVTTSSTASSSRTGTRTVTRTVTDTDADGNVRVRTYTDTILDTTPVTTTTTSSTPVTTLYNADGSTSVINGTTTTTSTSVDGDVSSSVVATALDSTAVTRQSVSQSSVQSTTLPVLKTKVTEHTASEKNGIQKIVRDNAVTTTTPMVRTVVTTPVTTTTYSNGTETVVNGTPVVTYELWGDVNVSHNYNNFFGRIDQLEVLDGINDNINRLLNHEPSRTKEKVRVFENNRFVQSYNADEYSADSKIFGGGFELDLSKGWTVGYQYNNVNINLRGVDSSTSQRKDVHGIFNTFHGNTLSLNTNAAIANSKYNYSRTVEGVFNNDGKTTGSEWWVSNRLYMHVAKWLHPFVGHTVQNISRNAYTETGSSVSARHVKAFDETTHVGEAGLKLETRFGGKKADVFGIGLEGSYATDNSYGATASIDYKEMLIVEGSHGVNNGVTNNSIAGKIKFRF